VKRIGLKFCGGCNPTHDRVETVRKIRAAAGDGVQWVPFDAGGFSALLIVNGCDKQCADCDPAETEGIRRVCIRDDLGSPTDILSMLLAEGDGS